MLVSIVKSNVRCKKCRLRLVLENYPQHQKSYKALKSCDWCRDSFHSICDLSRHVFAKHREEQDTFEQQYGQKSDGEDLIEMGEVIANVCNNCGECFSAAENLEEHIPKCKSEDIINLESGENSCRTGENSQIIDLTENVKEENEKTYTCVSCRDSFGLSALVGHIKSEHAETNVAMIPCSVCGVVFMHTTTLFAHLDEHLKTGSDKCIGVHHQCYICLRNFHELEALPVHMRLHKPKKMICPVCPRRFKDEVSLKQHLVFLHTELEYCCPRCDKTFSNYSNMILHQDSHNTHQSRYCIRCNRNFSSPLDFQKHIKLHGKFPLQFPSAESDTLQIGTDDSKPFGCVKCKQCFKSAEALSVHSVTHQNFKRCKKCRGRLRTKQDEKDHQKNCKPLQCICAECGRGMSSQHNLKRHIYKIHLGKK